MPGRDFDILVVGGGHAGAEAAWAAARLGARTALLTFDASAIGRLSCNPAIGGIGKGQIVREIDALGGLMGRVTDEAGIQFRMLNRRKGPAMWAPRAQVDHQLYPTALQRWLTSCPGLTIITAGVEGLLTEPCHGQTFRRRMTGVQTTDGATISAPAVIITSGTFLRGLMHTGERQTAGGRVGEAAAVGLSAALAQLGLELGRLKTGTPPRLRRDTIDFDQLEPQFGDGEPAPFSFMTDAIRQPQIVCWITHTNGVVHDAIRANLHRAPMYSGQIDSRGPRYCPSIEDKVVRFADKSRHQLFLEPEGRDSARIYANGISTSLPEDVQRRIVAAIPGLQRAEIMQLGYAVEYDFVPPEQLDATLMVKHVGGLFLAGQICGTSGYEEAAGQGLLAGINAARRLSDAPPVVLRRDQAYIGVMIDDLVTRGVTEPYRMFTSRAEHRLCLRYDNADARLTSLGHELGLVDGARWARYETKRARVARLRRLYDELRHEGQPLANWLRRPNEDGERFVALHPELGPLRAARDAWSHSVIETKYAGYIARQSVVIARMGALEDRELPADFDFSEVANLRTEAVERLNAIRPRNIGQASRISGIHPTDITLLLVGLGSLQKKTDK